MSLEESTWQIAATVLDPRVAHSIAALLESETLLARVQPDSQTANAIECWRILVPSEQLEAAPALLGGSQLTDSELTFLATRELGGS